MFIGVNQVQSTATEMFSCDWTVYNTKAKKRLEDLCSWWCQWWSGGECTLNLLWRPDFKYSAWPRFFLLLYQIESKLNLTRSAYLSIFYWNLATRGLFFFLFIFSTSNKKFCVWLDSKSRTSGVITNLLPRDFNIFPHLQSSLYLKSTQS